MPRGRRERRASPCSPTYSASKTAASAEGLSEKLEATAYDAVLLDMSFYFEARATAPKRLDALAIVREAGLRCWRSF